MSALYDPAIAIKYSRRRFFLSCEAASDGDSLLENIRQFFKLPEKSSVADVRRVIETVNVDVLLLLHNLETPWESSSTRAAVERLLSHLVDIPRLSLIVTMRGAERPQGVAWTRPAPPPLSTLSMDAVKETFVAISDISENDPVLELLLERLDMLPLAVTLMATQAQFLSLDELTKQWDSQRTKMVTRGLDDRLSSLDISIELSLNCERLLKHPEAKQLLRSLALLVDGAAVDELPSLMPAEFRVQISVTTLLRVALAYRDISGNIRVFISGARICVDAHAHISRTI